MIFFGCILAFALALLISAGVSVAAGKSDNFRAHLNGASEAVEVDTRAQGQAIFRLSKDGMTLYYKLIVANIDNVFMAHIHVAPEGSLAISGGAPTRADFGRSEWRSCRGLYYCRRSRWPVVRKYPERID